jgi:hypothetical protein
VNPGATEVAYDGIDNDCSGGDLTDVDGDGYDAETVGGNDCDDDDSGINPGATETPYDGVDDDCSGADLTDVDGDGYDAETVGGTDCDDGDITIHPGATDVPDDGIDQDCDGADATSVTVLEDFESGSWSTGSWISVAGGGTLSSSGCHEGAYCLEDPGWYYMGGPSTGYAGAVIGAWVKAGSGRAYLGFDSSSSGTKSFVMAPNTGDIRFQTNSGYSYTELTTVSTSFTTGAWYYMEVTLGSSGTATGRLYNSSMGLVNSVSHSYGSWGGGTLAIRSFSGFTWDYITLE